MNYRKAFGHKLFGNEFRSEFSGSYPGPLLVDGQNSHNNVTISWKLEFKTLKIHK